jgi:hypothetical protein
LLGSGTHENGDTANRGGHQSEAHLQEIARTGRGPDGEVGRSRPEATEKIEGGGRGAPSFLELLPLSRSGTVSRDRRNDGTLKFSNKV